MSDVSKLPWETLQAPGDSLDAIVFGFPGSARSGQVAKIREAAARRPYDTTVELHPHPESTALNIARVTRT